MKKNNSSSPQFPTAESIINQTHNLKFSILKENIKKNSNAVSVIDDVIDIIKYHPNIEETSRGNLLKTFNELFPIIQEEFSASPMPKNVCSLKEEDKLYTDKKDTKSTSKRLRGLNEI